MADKKLEIVISAIDKATAPIKGLSKTLNNFAESNKASFQKMAVGGGAAFGGIVFEMNRMVEAGKEAQRGAAQLEAVIKSTGGSAGLTAKEVSDMAGSLSELNAVSDDAILAGQNMLLTFTNIGKDVFPAVSQTMLDMATAMNGGLTPSAEALASQAMQLGKALNDPINGISALTRVGVTFTDQQKEQIKTLQENGDMMGAQKVILAELGKEFGGSALAQAQTYEGQMRKLSLALGESEEAIGLALIPTLNSLMETVKPIIKTVTDWIQLHPELSRNILLVVTSLFGLVAIMGTLGLLIPVITSGFAILRVAVMGLFGPIGLIIGAIGLLALAWENDWLGMRDVMSFVGKSIVAGANFIGGNLAIGIAKGVNLAITAINKLFDLLNKIPGVDIKHIQSDLINLKFISLEEAGEISWGISDAYKRMTSNAGESLKELEGKFKGMAGGVLPAMGKVGGEVKKTMDDLKNLGKETASALQGVFGGIVSNLDSQKSKLLGLKDDYQKLKDKLKEVGDTGVIELNKIQKAIDDQSQKVKDITGEGQIDIAKRLIEAQKELQKIKEKQVLGEGITNEELEKRFALEKEIALGESKTTGTERAKAIEESQKSEIQLLLDKNAIRIANAVQESLELQQKYKDKKDLIDKEKADVTLQMEQKKTEMLSEFALYQDLITKRKVIEEQYFSLFQKNIKQQMDKTVDAISLINQLNEKSGGNTVGLDGARALGGPVSANRSYLVGENGPEIFTPGASGKINNNPSNGSQNITINLGGVTVNGEADENRLVEKIKRALIRETQLYSNGIA